MSRFIKRKQVMVCHSEAEMNYKADALMEQGYHVEFESGVQPVTGLCFTTYRLIFWK